VTAAIADRAEDAGYPMLVRAHPEFVDLFPEGVSVVTVNADDDRSRPVYVSFGQDAPAVAEDNEDERPNMGPRRGAGPAERRPRGRRPLTESETPAGVLTTDFRADVDEDKLEHGLVTYRRFHRDESAVLKAFHEAVERWAAIDDHDHVVSILGHGERWLATRYDDGETFDRRGVPKMLAEAVYDAMSITKAVSYAHARGVVHGGLHPGTVRFVDTGGRTWDAPVVGDWGFAHGASGVQTPPVPVGFAAPEHREPERYGRFDQSTDVYGVGAMTYYLFTGEAPTDGDTLVPATEWNPALPDSVDELFSLSLASEKAARYDTVIDFQRALDELVPELGGEGWPDGDSGRERALGAGVHRLRHRARLRRRVHLLRAPELRTRPHGGPRGLLELPLVPRHRAVGVRPLRTRADAGRRQRCAGVRRPLAAVRYRVRGVRDAGGVLRQRTRPTARRTRPLAGAGADHRVRVRAGHRRRVGRRRRAR